MKKTWLFAILFVFGFGSSNAQSLLDNILGKDQLIIEMAIQKSCFLIRQDYILKDTAGLEYKSPNQEYFGRGYAIGVVSGKQLWTTALSRKPWVSDVNFTPQKGKFTPENYQSALRPVTALQFEKAQIWTPTIVNEVAVGKFERFEGATQGESKPTKGRLAVFYIKEGENPDSAAIQIATVQISNIQWDTKGMANEDHINLKGKRILGGALFTEKIGYGTISFELSGIYVKTEHLTDPWRIHQLPVPPKPVAPQTSVQQTDTEENPKKKRRKKKN